MRREMAIEKQQKFFCFSQDPSCSYMLVPLVMKSQNVNPKKVEKVGEIKNRQFKKR